MLVADISGFTGVVLYLASYALLQNGRLRQDSATYSWLNLLAASLVLISLANEFNLASAVIQLSWILISLCGLHRVGKVARKHCQQSRGNDRHSRADKLNQGRVIDHKRSLQPVQHEISFSEEERENIQTYHGVLLSDQLDPAAAYSKPQVVAFIDLGEPDLQRISGQHRQRVSLAKPPITQAPAGYLRSSWSRLSDRIDNLPPFWTAFALTLTETVAAGTLALPIAFATVGPLAGVALLVVLGLLNLLTVTYLAEASARNESVRHGNAFVGQMVAEFLGPSAALVMRLALFSYCCIILASYYTGFASTLSAATGLPAPLWVVVICGFGLVLVACKSMAGTLATALIVGSINILVIVLLSVLALSHGSLDKLLSTGITSASDGGFEVSNLQLVFGVVLVSYFGHLSVSNCAHTVLRRDPDGRSLKRGTAAAMLVAILIYCFWTISIGSAIDSDRLHLETGTALVPLAEQLGPEVFYLGIVFAVLGLGMSSIHYSLGIFNLTRELMSNVVKTCERPTWWQDHAATTVSMVPILTVFGYVQWTMYNGTASFTAPLELLGALVVPVLAGIFPVLLLIASRANGLPAPGAKVPAVLSSSFILALIVLLSFAGILTHAVLIWQQPMHKLAAYMVIAILLWMMAGLFRRDVFVRA